MIGHSVAEFRVLIVQRVVSSNPRCNAALVMSHVLRQPLSGLRDPPLRGTADNGTDPAEPLATRTPFEPTFEAATHEAWIVGCSVRAMFDDAKFVNTAVVLNA